jgi:hypothetical protein
MLNDAAQSELPDTPIPAHDRLGRDEGTPLFIGHCWLTGNPGLLSDKVDCVDYSIAKGGKLVAYHWDGKSVLNQKNFH